MEKHMIELIKHQRRSIRLMKKQNEYLKTLVETIVQQQPPLKENLLDNTDLKMILKIADTKFFQLKKEKKFPTYRLNGKDYYFENEIKQTIQNNKTT